ncbi:hypothetical protein [Xenorhabdus bovienii]|uniref:hypothetical protein n=1 Tax=Xenorhabdus bovienii TaxID=40576 RepID=UPI0023B2C2AE|nr:hypothetical protein [Xenorhabdus bovienii]MDE9456018.1 hypothetical protein [Xenorhabdus bovienii]
MERILLSIYKYKTESFFNESTLPFDNQFLLYKADRKRPRRDESKNRELCFKRGCYGDFLKVTSWDYLFREYMPIEYWNYIPDEFIKDKNIFGFANIDYYNINLIINRMFFIFDINKEACFYRKELSKFYYQYQASHYKSNDKTRIFFLGRLFAEVWVWDLAYKRLSIRNGELLYTAESGVAYYIHDLIDRFCDMIKAFSLPKYLQEMLDFINPMLHECIDFMWGKNESYDFNVTNVKYVEGKYFLETYRTNKAIIFNVLKDCVRDSQSSRELLISHMIIMDYSFFVLKYHPTDFLLLKEYLKNDDDMFVKILSLIVNIGFHVDKKTFFGLGLSEYIDKVSRDYHLLYNYYFE